MNEYTVIKFPGLGFEINPPFLVLPDSGYGVRWYGIIVALGFVAAIIYGLARAHKFGVARDDLVDILVVSVPVGVICARLYYIMFYNFDYYLQNPVEILYIWNGGLAIYGGILGGMLTAALVAKIKKIKALAALDLAAAALPLAQAIGRWGNLLNRESYGSPTEMPWRMALYRNGAWITAHPCFLYESLWNAAGFVLLYLLSKKRRFDGQVLLMYLAWYGLGRAIIEGLRVDSMMVGDTGIRINQMIAIATCVAAVALLIIVIAFIKPDPERMQSEKYARRLAKRNIDRAATELRAANINMKEVDANERDSD